MCKEIVLAPMEGVLDYPLRQIITSVNKFDYCESEFIRVSDVVFPRKVFFREVPELRTGGCTANGTPVWVQLLGSQPEIMAGNAKVAADNGALGIDLNFGCPSRFVHRTCGGAAMLRYPQRIGEIVKQVRDILPSHVGVSAKIRLGWESEDELDTIMEEVVKGGADKVIIHARTKKDGYKEEAIKWHCIAPQRAKYELPIIANGEIKDKDSAHECMRQSQCDSLMLARYALSIPNLERVIRNNEQPYSYIESAQLLKNFIELIEQLLPEFYQKARVKQFMNYLRLHYEELQQPFRAVCQQETMVEIKKIIDSIK